MLILCLVGKAKKHEGMVPTGCNTRPHIQQLRVGSAHAHLPLPPIQLLQDSIRTGPGRSGGRQIEARGSDVTLVFSAQHNRLGFLGRRRSFLFSCTADATTADIQGIAECELACEPRINLHSVFNKKRALPQPADMHPQSSQPPSKSQAFSVAQQAVEALGRGYDVTCDLWLSYCKSGERLIANDNSSSTQDLHLPGNILIPNVSTSIKCDKGDRTRLITDILTFNEMSERFNQDLAISGKIPLGHFNAMFNLSGSWQKDASSVKALTMNGVFINLYNVELPRTQLTLKEEVKAAVPSSWDPAALAGFVEKYGTHVIVGVKIGGKDVIYIKQHSSSSLSAVGVQKILEAKSKERFSSVEGNTSRERINKGKIRDGSMLVSNGMNSGNAYQDAHKSGVPYPWMNDSSADSTIETNEVTVIFKRKGGWDSAQTHEEWLQTVPSAPDIVSMSFVPITSLLNGVTGTGFLSHAINLYLRYKPPIQELHHFLEFQLPKEWAPAYGDLPLGPPRKQHGSPSLQFRPLGPKLQVNTTPVMVGKRCVTGARLHLEGKKGNRLAIHLQYLTVVPQILQSMWEDDQPELWEGPDSNFHKYFEPVMWKSFSHVCTAPVESPEAWDDDGKGEQGGARSALVVTGAQLDVEQHVSKKVLFLKLLYSKIQGASIRRSEWDHTPASQQKSGIFSTLMSTTFTSPQATHLKPEKVVVNSAIYPQGPPPANSQAPKLLKFVDCVEMTRGPVDLPGHWLMTGAKLFVDRGKIAVRVKYSLLLYSMD
ncbi:hypothetical protein GOP47_0005100 [Adiantum capillus-veneris]|uniref:MACPF domain-containing protein n=1 Tax=Adiantum capillus-veneris TaxID=13818 RepID=A0A9D4V4H9_ADICA|nr:hypothetical protein GOP47_0005100 [Adiantum capillus-veneris]